MNNTRTFCTFLYAFTWAIMQKSSYRHFEKYTHGKTGCTILDIGTGTGEYIKFIAKNNHYILTDIDSKSLKKAENRARKYLKNGSWDVKVGDASSVVATEKVDIISCLHAISSLYNPNEFVSLALDSLNQGGELLIYIGYPSKKKVSIFYSFLMRIFKLKPVNIEKILYSFKFSQEKISLFNYCYTVRK